MLTRNQTETMDHPYEPGVRYEFKMLSWRDLEAARQAAIQASIKTISDIGSEVLDAMKDVSSDDASDDDDDSGLSFDRGELLRRGIVGWSYDDELNAEAIDDLDDPSAEWAEKEILKLSRRTASEGEASSGA